MKKIFQLSLISKFYNKCNKVDNHLSHISSSSLITWFDVWKIVSYNSYKKVAMLWSFATIDIYLEKGKQKKIKRTLTKLKVKIINQNVWYEKIHQITFWHEIAKYQFYMQKESKEVLLRCTRNLSDYVSSIGGNTFNVINILLYQKYFRWFI